MKSVYKQLRQFIHQKDIRNSEERRKFAGVSVQNLFHLLQI